VIADSWQTSGLGSAAALLGDEVPETVRDSPASALRYEMAQLLRELNRLVLEADAPAEDFEFAATLLDQARSLLARHPTRRPQRWEASALSGKFNAIAPPLINEPSPKAGVFRCKATLPTGWGGPDDLVHGGVLAKILDMCFGAAGGLNQTPGVTGTLTVRYERPTPLNEELIFESWVDHVDGRKVHVAGHVLRGDEVTVTATGVMIRQRDPAP
jgi:hypothetical protein